ncbi:Uncharacterised protein [Candidatus Bartonella washoeensis]|uniref:Uncharacterized protein n=2 Tax=Candidatus Bartonella washoeensis TaxID=186739 RepID=J1J4C8_9HYPH|nr:hypothetical protein [Bartonella washoeensis]EJF78987.1 hypothetical protein MCQ_00932 [Bartonella washoeensis Sb944nv]SPU26468.1 Uncharacterised protein [Bartonella washoeensis]
MSLVAVVISLMANVISFYAVHDSSKRVRRLRKELAEKNELIASQKALMEGQLTENEKKIQHLQQLQEEVQERLTEYGQRNPEKQECLMSYENLQVPEDVRALVREFVEKAPIIEDDRTQKILIQLMRDEQKKNEAIEIIEDFNRWFMEKQSVTVAEANKWDRVQYLSFLLMQPRPMTWGELAEKSPEEQHRYASCWKTVIY